MRVCGEEISYIVRCEMCHFWLSALVGASAYSLTLTILSHITPGRMGDSFTHRFSLVVALSCAAAAHILEDYTWNAF